MSVLYLLGDSTCAIKREDARPETGWGEEFQSYVKDGWIVDNRAINGRSTKSFIDEGNFDSILEVADFGDSAIKKDTRILLAVMSAILIIWLIS